MCGEGERVDFGIAIVWDVEVGRLVEGEGEVDARLNCSSVKMSNGLKWKGPKNELGRGFGWPVRA